MMPSRPLPGAGEGQVVEIGGLPKAIPNSPRGATDSSVCRIQADKQLVDYFVPDNYWLASSCGGGIKS
jgi:hypothetical protein